MPLVGKHDPAGQGAVGKKRGRHPSPATVMRMLREHDEQAATAGGPVIPQLVRSRCPSQNTRAVIT